MTTSRGKTRWLIRTLACAVLLIATAATAQDLTAPPPFGEFPRDLPMQHSLWRAEQAVREAGLAPADARALLQRRRLQADARGRVLVEIVGPEGAGPVAPAIVREAGGEVRLTWRQRTSAFVPVLALTELARQLPDGYVLQAARPPVHDDVPGEGPAAVGSDVYRDGGADGTGITVAVIDTDFDELTEGQNQGDAPPPSRTTRVNLAPGGFEDDGTHGTGCLEVAFDHCPGATWRLYRIASMTGLGNAVDDAIANGVDVITHSLSWFNTGWEDDEGPACQAATDAAEAGILFFTSAGNSSLHHYQGTFNDPDGDGWHNFQGADELIEISEPDSVPTTFLLSWDRAGAVHNYDLYLYDDDLDVIDSSTSIFEIYEDLDYVNDSPNPVTVQLAVYSHGSSVTEFEIFETSDLSSWQQFVVPSSSTTSPSNTTHGRVISVGAVDWSQFGQPSGTGGIIEDYSSRGPSNSGATLPDLCGPTDTACLAYPGGFGGTSSATPNAAGATAAFWSSASDLDATGIHYLLRQQAHIFRDWNGAGMDDTYGEGGLQLHDYAPATTWVDRRLGNVAGNPARPYYYVADAEDATPSGGRIVFLGQSYLEPVTLTRAVSYESIGWTAFVGSLSAP